MNLYNMFSLDLTEAVGNNWNNSKSFEHPIFY